MYRLLGELWEGAHFTCCPAPRCPATRTARRCIEILVKYEPKLVGKENTALAGATAMITAVEGLNKAGRNLTRESYVEAMESIKGFTARG